MKKKNAIIGGLLTLLIASAAPPAAAVFSIIAITFMGSLTISLSFEDHSFARTCILFAIIALFKVILDFGTAAFGIEILLYLLAYATAIAVYGSIMLLIIYVFNSIIFRYRMPLSEIKIMFVIVVVYQTLMFVIKGNV